MGYGPNHGFLGLFCSAAALTFCGLATEIGAAADLESAYRITGGVFESKVEYHQTHIPKGQEIEMADLKGPGKVTYWYITDDTRSRWYPGLVLKIFWDGASEPSVQVPLADFFGALGGRSVDYESSPLHVHENCFMCYLPMPFAQRARFVLANDGDRDYSQSMAYGIDYESDAAYAAEKSRLHAVWQRTNPVENGLHLIAETKGTGHFIGGFLQVHTLWKGWWGEGDMIFRVDGQAITHSPGTEDEYGSCWGTPEWSTYAGQYCGHLLNEGGTNRLYRWYLANPVRFREGLKVEIQNQHWGKNGQAPSHDDYTSVAFWYQEGTQPVKLPPFSERTAASRATAVGLE